MLGHACAHLGVLAGPTGYALGAPSLFLDSVLFPSHCLDTVHEHCSSQIFLKKKKFRKNKIKSNKMRQNFGKIKFLLIKMIDVSNKLSRIVYECRGIVYKMYCVNSVSRLCLSLRDTALYLTAI